jgi:energy-coupling factor transporter ATP-binding protein EcfA2
VLGPSPRFDAGATVTAAWWALGALILAVLAIATTVVVRLRSGLERRRAHSAAADEPTAHQDVASKKRIVDAVTAAARSGTAVLAATHDSAVLDVADRRIRMADGRLR